MVLATERFRASARAERTLGLQANSLSFAPNRELTERFADEKSYPVWVSPKAESVRTHVDTDKRHQYPISGKAFCWTRDEYFIWFFCGLDKKNQQIGGERNGEGGG